MRNTGIPGERNGQRSSLPERVDERDVKCYTNTWKEREERRGEGGENK